MIDVGAGISNPLFFIGVVEENVDKRLEGRVQVRAFSVHGNQDEVPTSHLPWAICAAGNYDANNPPPKLNSFVYGMFLDGRDAQHPIILGLIPTQFTEVINPSVTGWGVIPDRDGDILAQGASPNEACQPQNSRLARGENIEETYVLTYEMTRVEGVKIAGTDETWDEPACAYAAKYPYNRVIETARHSIELDDTPGAERIMIRHDAGSHIQMDASGSVSYKSAKDKSDVSLQNENVYVGGKSVIHIKGDSHVYVHGNKTEEINGDYNLIVHGNSQIGVGGQLSLNASDQVQIRGADVKLDANVSTLTLRAKRNVHLGSDETILMYTSTINQTALNKIDMTAALDYNINAGRDYSVFSSNIFGTATGAMSSETVDGQKGIHLNSVTSTLNVKAATNINILGPTVNIDNFVNLAGGFAQPALATLPPLICFAPNESVMPAPPVKSTALTNYKQSGTSSLAGLSTSMDRD
jgi:hypothetical protein